MIPVVMKYFISTFDVSIFLNAKSVLSRYLSKHDPQIKWL